MELTKLGLKGADIASASTITPDGRFDRFDVTGTTGITAIHTDGRAIGARFYLRFTAAVTLTHDASNLILAGSSNITTAAGDVMLFEAIGTNQVRQLAVIGEGGSADGSGYFEKDMTGITAYTLDPDEARCGALRFYGAPGGTCVVTMPDNISRVWAVTSEVTGEFGLDLKDADGNGGVNMSPGSLVVYRAIGGLGIQLVNSVVGGGGGVGTVQLAEGDVSTTATAYANDTAPGSSPEYMFDGSAGTDWESSDTVGTKTVGVDLGSGYRAIPTSYDMTCNTNSACVSEWAFKGSGDSTDGLDGTWTTLDSRTGVTWTTSPHTRTFNTCAVDSYRWLRFDFTANGGSGVKYAVLECTIYGASVYSGVTTLRLSGATVVGFADGVLELTFP